ncbi:hypothetical protein LshimejAT787_0905380 [Lyophyllum shimeji]|uniref:Uncharacterized protein n=1 Tax=Lyophyllum shimeji TaxID=47721 RepID=A0A9P3PSN1_LYOSH|nr:hypothetical protein LshimejAT787_0905380 [Lyophyllum shimeji]
MPGEVIPLDREALGRLEHLVELKTEVSNLRSASGQLTTLFSSYEISRKNAVNSEPGGPIGLLRTSGSSRPHPARVQRQRQRAPELVRDRPTHQYQDEWVAEQTVPTKLASLFTGLANALARLCERLDQLIAYSDEGAGLQAVMGSFEKDLKLEIFLLLRNFVLQWSHTGQIMRKYPFEGLVIHDIVSIHVYNIESRECLSRDLLLDDIGRITLARTPSADSTTFDLILSRKNKVVSQSLTFQATSSDAKHVLYPAASRYGIRGILCRREGRVDALRGARW